jgi:RNA polymerase sigma factor (sigma-70 family)
MLSASQSDHDDADLLADGRIEHLLAKYEPVIVARCIKATKNVHDGHDVAQDVMFRLFREFEAGKRYEGLPYRVVVHQVTKWTLADFFAGRRTDSPLPDDLELGMDDPGDRVVSELWLRKVVDQLPEVERAACTLVYPEGLSPEQAAGRLGTTRNNVDQRLFHARKHLRELMGDDG